ncbi:hypothetical protein UCDDA912_g01262 [Diaporthe ampelina]|uniref:Uncharacterized protein n=1 Tax=Diaporthe ampelina TaxID=1214573 RepID=A0A0G2FX16_9PEZI|nr:hypothetical protein UCDDA912_g01262 [Diaporthe ampelina]
MVRFGAIPRGLGSEGKKDVFLRPEPEDPDGARGRREDVVFSADWIGVGKEQILLLLFPVCVFNEAESWSERGLTAHGSMLLVAESPRERQDTRQENDGAECYEATTQSADKFGLVEIDESI